MEGVLHGNLEDLPEMKSNSVRIFLSSTFTDMTCERDALMSDVYPRLTEYCREQGLDFRVCDMRWGILEWAADSHQTTHLCMREIQACQAQSVATDFVAMLGHRYGYCPIQDNIPEDEFELIMKAIEEPDDLEIVRTWYFKDENCIPPQYCLQPISVGLKNYYSEDEDLKDADRKKWKTISSLLYEVLKSAVSKCTEIGSAAEKYYTSVTEMEVKRGLLENFKSGRALCFFRTLSNFKDHLSHPKMWRFVELKGGQVDDVPTKQLEDLKKKTQKKLSSKEVKSFDIQWLPQVGGISKETHKEYLKGMCDQFHDMVVHQIKNRVESDDIFANHEHLHEVLFHLHFAIKSCRTFRGREEIIQTLQEYLSNPMPGPIMICGDPGIGKTALVTEICRRTKTWFNQNAKPVVVVRFLGCTPASSSVHSLLLSMCLQIVQVYGIEEEVPSDFDKLKEFFITKSLTFASAGKPLVVILDGLDHLQPSFDAYTLNWIPWKLPNHVHFIITYSTLIKGTNVQNTARAARSINLANITKEEALEMLNAKLHDIHRTVSTEQLEVLKNALEVTHTPLYVSVLFYQVMKWKSPSQVSIKTSTEDVINQLIEDLEHDFGVIIIKHALSYITCSLYGLEESELLDIISLDDDVLNEAFQYYEPPIRRLPPFLWTRIKDCLSEHLNIKIVRQSQLLSWKHRAFRRGIKARYLKDEDFKKLMHSRISDYFLGTWAAKEKPFTYTEFLAKRLKLKDLNGKADRKVPSQPVKWDVNGEAVINHRKISELPYSLFKSERYDEFRDEVVLNVQVLAVKRKRMSMPDAIADLAVMKEFILHPKVGMLKIFDPRKVIASAPSQMCSMLKETKYGSKINNVTQDVVSKIERQKTELSKGISQVKKEVAEKSPSRACCIM